MNKYECLIVGPKGKIGRMQVTAPNYNDAADILVNSNTLIIDALGKMSFSNHLSEPLTFAIVVNPEGTPKGNQLRRIHEATMAEMIRKERLKKVEKIDHAFGAEMISILQDLAEYKDGVRERAEELLKKIDNVRDKHHKAD